MRQGRTRGRPEPGPPRSRSARSTPTREMRLRTKAPAPRSTHSPSRTAGQVCPRGDSEGQQPNYHKPYGETGEMTIAQVESASGEGQTCNQEPAERSTPLIPLTFRAMNSTRHPSVARPNPLSCFCQCLLCWHLLAFRFSLRRPNRSGPVRNRSAHRQRAHHPSKPRPGGGTPANLGCNPPIFDGSNPSRIRVWLGGNPSAMNSQSKHGWRRRHRLGWPRQRFDRRWRQRPPPGQQAGSLGGAQPVSSHSPRTTVFLAPDPDPDRDRRSRGHLDRRRRGQATAPAQALPRAGFAEGELA